jgi:acetyl-CoA acetyltransferase
MNVSGPGAIRDWRYEADFQKPFGVMGPNSQFAFVMRRHMHQYNTRIEDIGKIAVVQRDHSTRNPYAYLKSPLTLEQYLTSRQIADPVKLFDACISVNGGLGFLVASAEAAKRFPRDNVVWVKGMAEFHNYRHGSDLSPDITYLGMAKSGPEAFRVARITYKDVDFLQAYDDYTLAVMIQIEDLGFCKKGEAGAFTRDHDISYKGDLPLNTGGGQLSAGQPGMAGGMVHLVEAVRQLRGQGGDRQVEDAETGVVTGIGCLGYGNSLSHSCTAVMVT